MPKESGPDVSWRLRGRQRHYTSKWGRDSMSRGPFLRNQNLPATAQLRAPGPPLGSDWGARGRHPGRPPNRCDSWCQSAIVSRPMWVSMLLTWRRGRESLNTGNSAPELSDVRPLMTQPETRNPFVIDRSSVQVRSSASGLALDRESIGLSPPVWRRSDTPSKRFRNNPINTRCLIVVRPR